MKTKSVVIAESSGTVSQFLSSIFTAKGFAVTLFEEGLSTLDYVLKNEVDCLLCNVKLPLVEGYHIATVLKDGSKKHWVPVILYSTEDNESVFWNDMSSVNELLYLSANNEEQIVSSVETCISQKELYESMVHDEDVQLQEENPVVCAVTAMEKKFFKYRLSEISLDMARKFRSSEDLVFEILRQIYQICEFDNAALILNRDPAIFYYAGPESLSLECTVDFKKICRSDYESKLNLSNSIEYIEKNVNVSLKSDVIESYKSYRTFTFETDDGKFAGTLHLASAKRKFFTYKLISALEYFVSRITPVLIHAMEYENLVTAEKRMHAAFAKFVPEEIISEMIKNDDTQNESVTEKRRVAIMICDIRNFTTISEMNEPESVVGFLNGYFSRMVEIIKKNGGSIDKFMGDAIMANFGAPISYSDNAKRAVDAAIEMTEALKKIPCQMLKFSEKVKGIDIGIGIHYGEVIVGNIGCKEKTDYTVIGDSANLASRLEGLSKQYGARIIVSKDVIEGMEDAVRKDVYGNELKEVERKQMFASLLKNYNFIQLDKVKVKGKLKGIEIFRVGEKKYSADYKENYEKGLSLYFLGNFGYARDYFVKARNCCSGTDKACSLMIDICNEFKENPPAAWDGARELTSK